MWLNCSCNNVETMFSWKNGLAISLYSSPTWPVCNQSQGPFSLRVCHRNSNSMEISFHSHLDSNKKIATKFCTWHDSMCKKLWRFGDQQWNYSKAKFQSNLNCEQKIVNETGPLVYHEYTSTGVWARQHSLLTTNHNPLSFIGTSQDLRKWCHMV